MADTFANNLVETLKDVLAPDNSDPIALHEPEFAGNEWDYVKDCLDTGQVSSVGKYVDLFEKRLAEYCGVKHAVAAVNGTAALHIALMLAGVSKGDEVFVPALTFVATANAVNYCGAVPHFTEASYNTLGMCPQKLDQRLHKIGELRDGFVFNRQTGRRITAIVPMHVFGHPVDMGALKTVATKWNLPIVEDAGESLGSTYKKQQTGGLGLVGVLSFNGNKTITSGGGGAILTNLEWLAEKAKHLTTTAKKPHSYFYQHDAVGYNYRLPNINAALGVAQLEMLPQFLSQKRALAARYQNAFKDFKGASFVTEPEHCKSNYWLNAILLDEASETLRNEVLKTTNDAGIMTRPVWNLLCDLPMYDKCPCATITIARDLAARLINIPSSAKLGHK